MKDADKPAAQAAPKKQYSNPYHSLEAIWTVLRLHASKKAPLTVREIHGYLKQMESAPSLATLNRLLPGAGGLTDALYPGVLAQSGKAAAVDAYHDGQALHIVLETPEGRVFSRDGAGVEITAEPFRAPSYSAVDKLLKDGVPFDLHTYPFRLRCVARLAGEDGRPRFVPYDRWLDRLEEGAQNNVPRRYYLANPLTEGEWRIFSDLVQVYPFISPDQTGKFLTVLNRLRPGKVEVPAARYAYKKGNPDQFRIINQLDRAIRDRKKVRLVYGEYRLVRQEGRWVPAKRRREKNGLLEVEPYALMWSNGNYYLVCRHQGLMNLRADRILLVEPMEETFTPPADFDPARYRDRSPVMYPGENTFVHLRCKTALLNTLVDFFGDLPQYTAPTEDGFTQLSMSIAPAGVKLFALQYADGVEVLEPAWLRQEVLDTLERAVRKYRGGGS